MSTTTETDTNTDTAIVVIGDSGGGERIHVYPGIEALVGDELIRDRDAYPAATEFFDRSGRRMLPVFGPGWRLVGLRRSREEAEPATLLRRLRETVTQIQRHLPSLEAELSKHGLSVEEATAQLPDLSTDDLGEAVNRCDLAFGHGARRGLALPVDVVLLNNGSPLHNLLVHGIF